MKKITNIFKMMSIISLTCFLGSITTVGLKNNDVVSDKKQCKNSINENELSVLHSLDSPVVGMIVIYCFHIITYFDELLDSVLLT